MENNYWFDIDGVLADFCQHVIDYFNLPNHPFTEWNDSRIRDNWHLMENDINFWLTIPAINHNIPVKVAGYITARPVPSCLSSYWLSKNGFPYAEVITLKPMGVKAELLKDRPNVILIDDAIHNYNDCILQGVKCKLYTTPYNYDLIINDEDRIFILEDLIKNP